MISSVRAALQKHPWLRFIVFFSIMMGGFFVRDALHERGVSHTSFTGWIFGAFMAASILIYALLSNDQPVWLPVAGRSRSAHLAYGALFWTVSAVFLAAAWAHPSINNPVLVISAALFVPLCIADLLARRRLKKQTLIAAK